MKRAVLAVPISSLLLSSFAFGGYSYTISDSLYTPTWSHWGTDGNPITPIWYSPGGYGGIAQADYMVNANGGYPPHYGAEERLTIRQDSAYPNAYIYMYPGVTWDTTSYVYGGYALLWYMGAGGGYAYLSRSWTDPSFGTPHNVMLASGFIGAHDGVQVRVIAKPVGSDVLILVYQDNVEVMRYYDVSPPACGPPTWATAGSGEFGFGISNASGGTLISQVDIGNIDGVAPNPVPAGSIGVSAATNQVALTWPAATDDTNGTGVYAYQIYRNGAYLASTTGLSFTDTANISPSLTYTYTLAVVDFHENVATTNFSVSTPNIGTSPPFPSATPEGRRVGVRPTATYWGGGNENIDVMSGNLNYTLPLLKPQGRGGWKVGFNLTYNSQLWKKDSGGTWLFDGDVGYGLGWKLQAGSITPVWNPGNMTAAYYLFSDSTGAEYRLDQNNGNVWSSKESVYVYFDANGDVLHFRDGTFWTFGCVSGPGEADQGVMHPTAMEDTNGNQILIRYMMSPGANWTNSSARITQIEDVRATNQSGTYMTYAFTYNSDPIRHLTSITNYIGSGEGYTFTYLTNQALSSPFTGTSYGTTTFLNTAAVTTLGLTNTFAYNGYGEATKFTLPYNGYLAYDYVTSTYSSGRSYREVQNRYLSKDGTLGSQKTYPFSHEASPGPDVHAFTVLVDGGGVGAKYWIFATSGLAMGLVTEYQAGQISPSALEQTQNDFSWAQDSIGNSYIGATLTTLDPYQTYQAQKMTTQAVDNYGNVTQIKNYDYGNLTTPARTYSYTYVTAGGYLSRYIYNRLSTASVTNGTTTIPLATNTYDFVGYQYPCNIAAMTTVTGLREWDATYSTGLTTRGNLSISTTPSGFSCMTYDQTGTVTSISSNGHGVAATTAASNNFAAPTQITAGSLTTNLSWTSFLGLTNETGANGDSASTYYDAYARQSSVTSPFGATTTYAYSNPPYSPSAPPTVTATVNGRWTRQTLDGLGRTILTETGDSSGTKSQAETVYDPCGCSPLGKMTKTAMPHTVGATPVWTTYTYDGIGRTLKVVSPDGASTATYSYQGNTVTATDPAGKSKTFTMDAWGNLKQVQEPNPAGGSAYVTSYSYDLLNNLTQVSMPRPTGTQTRTFVYSGNNLMSATNPENGTVTYTYNVFNKVATRTDARNVQVQYTYDGLGRLTLIQRGYLQNGQYVDGGVCAQEIYSYDSNPYDGTYSQYTYGRLTAVQYYGGARIYGGSAYGGPSWGCSTKFTEMYSYNQAGAKVAKRLRTSRLNIPWYANPNYYSPTTYVEANGDLNSTYTYDGEGKMTGMQYPVTGFGQQPGPNLIYGFDTMGRLNTMTDTTSNNNIVTGTTYNAANQVLSMVGQYNETRTYNSMLQLTQLTIPGTLNMTYGYSGTQNNGKMQSQTDNLSGEQVVYTYDALNRLASAAATNNSWGQSYSYDGFSNLTAQTVIAGSAPAYQVTVDGTTNHVGGEDAAGNAAAANCGNQYDYENRLGGTGCNLYSPWAYTYAPGNKRIWRGVTPDDSGNYATDEVTFWSVAGTRLATYQVSIQVGNGPNITPQILLTPTSTRTYFGRRLLGGDVRGSFGKFYPYGQEKPSATQNGTEKFTGYLRDSETGLDYAVNRFHNPGTGRFLTADLGVPDLKNPSSWNRYTYVINDPINHTDRWGLDEDLMQGPGGDGGMGGGCFEGYFGPGTYDPTCEDYGPEPPLEQPPTSSPSGPIPCEIDAFTINTYIATKPIFGDPSLSKPLAGMGQAFIDAALLYNTNPAVLVAIAFQESHWGYDTRNSGTDNAFGLRHADGSPLTFDSWQDGIFTATKSVNSAYDRGNRTVADLYSGMAGGYCTHPDCPGAITSMENRVRAMGEDPNYLGFDCELKNGVLVKK